MHEFFTMAFLVLSGGFLFGIMIYAFYLGLISTKNKPSENAAKEMHVKKPKAKPI